MSIVRIMMWITGGLEAFLGIPFFGGAFILSLLWTPLVVMLVLHIATLILAIQKERKVRGSILGIIASCIGWIPFAGMVMHLLAATFLMVDASEPDQKPKIQTS